MIALLGFACRPANDIRRRTGRTSVCNVAALGAGHLPTERPLSRDERQALEFGVRFRRSPRLVVLGHGQCGGVRARWPRPAAAGARLIASWSDRASRRWRRLSGAEGGVARPGSRRRWLSVARDPKLSPGLPRRPRPGGLALQGIRRHPHWRARQRRDGSRRSVISRPAWNNRPKALMAPPAGAWPGCKQVNLATASRPQAASVRTRPTTATSSPARSETHAGRRHTLVRHDYPLKSLFGPSMYRSPTVPTGRETSPSAEGVRAQRLHAMKQRDSLQCQCRRHARAEWNPDRVRSRSADCPICRQGPNGLQAPFHPANIRCAPIS